MASTPVSHVAQRGPGRGSWAKRIIRVGVVAIHSRAGVSEHGRFACPPTSRHVDQISPPQNGLMVDLSLRTVLGRFRRGRPGRFVGPRRPLHRLPRARYRRPLLRSRPRGLAHRRRLCRSACHDSATSRPCSARSRSTTSVHPGFIQSTSVLTGAASIFMSADTTTRNPARLRRCPDRQGLRRHPGAPGGGLGPGVRQPDLGGGAGDDHGRDRRAALHCCEQRPRRHLGGDEQFLRTWRGSTS